MKKCKTCGTEKDESEFYVHRKANKKAGREVNELFGECKPCKSIRSKRYYSEKPHVARSLRYRRRYGITLEQYAEMLKAQAGVCAICKEPETRIQCGKIQLLSVDHDHSTGKARALLCNGCNIVIGNCRERPEILELAIEYLKCAKAAQESNH